MPVIELSDEQKEQILNSGEFSKFFDKATRMMERALCETVDITFDYSGAETEDTEGWVFFSGNLFIPKSDKYVISHNSITPESNINVKRIEEMIMNSKSS